MRDQPRVTSAGSSHWWSTHAGEGEERGVAAGLIVAAAIFYLAPWAPLYVVALAGLAFLTWRRLDLALPLVILFAPLFMQPKHIGSEQFAPSEIFIALDIAVAALWWLDPVRRSRLEWKRLWGSPFLIPALLFFLAATVSTVFAADHHQALQAYRERIVEPMAFFALLLLLEVNLAQWRLSFGGLLAIGLLVCAIGVLQRLTNHNLSTDPGSAVHRVQSVYQSPDNLGLLLDRVLPVWLAIALLGRLTGLRRLLWYAGGVLLIVTLLLTYSRGAWVGVALAAFFMLALVGGRVRLAAIAAIVIAVVAAAIAGPRIANAVNSSHPGTVQRRVYLWQSSARMIRDHPIVGIGPDNFLHYYAPKSALYLKCNPGLGYLDPRASVEPCLSHPHNEILDAWLSTGIVGLLALVWLEAVFWLALVRIYPTTSIGVRTLLLGAGGAMLASLIHGLVDNSYFLPDLAIMFWLLCGVVSWAATGSPEPSAAA